MKEVTELVMIIDRSGSMNSIKNDIIGGINSFIEEQKKNGETRVTTVLFNDEIKFINEDINISEVSKMDEKNYVPSGCTALLDAVGDSISFIKARHAKLKEEELPKNTIVVITTDGLENASKEYSYNQIKSMIELQKKCGWTFIFQAANIDVVKEADRLGVDQNYAMSFKANSEGVHKQMTRMCCVVNDVIQENNRKNDKRK